MLEHTLTSSGEVLEQRQADVSRERVKTGLHQRLGPSIRRVKAESISLNFPGSMTGPEEAENLGALEARVNEGAAFLHLCQ